MDKDYKKEMHISVGTSSGKEGLKKEKRSKTQDREGLYIKRAFEEMEKDLSLPSEEIFERICERIFHEEEKERPVKENAQRSEGIYYSLFNWLREIFGAPGFAWGFCAVQAVVFVFAFFVLKDRSPRYETMTYHEHAGHGQVYKIIFKDDVSFGDVVSFLQKNHMKIIDGPSKKALFLVKIEKNNIEIERLKSSEVLDFVGKAY